MCSFCIKGLCTLPLPRKLSLFSIRPRKVLLPPQQYIFFSVVHATSCGTAALAGLSGMGLIPLRGKIHPGKGQDGFSPSPRSRLEARSVSPWWQSICSALEASWIVLVGASSTATPMPFKLEVKEKQKSCE